MKLAGLTWWRNNYGSILQAYALQHELNSFPDIQYEIINQYGKKITSADNFISKLKSLGVRKTLNRAFWKYGFKQVRSRSNAIQQFVDQNLYVSKQQFNEETIHNTNKIYDGFVCGSDQVWNPTLTSLSGMYWLTFADKEKLKFAYAPSIGVDYLTKEERNQIFNNLQSFKGISCREESGTNLLNTIVDGRCCTVLDPTLLVNRILWDEICSERKYPEPYIFVYMLRGTKKQRKLVEKYAKEKKLKIVAMPFLETEHIVWYDLKFGDYKMWDADPTDFISVIKHAECVFTDSFHSSVFSCIYHIPFYFFPKIGIAQMGRIAGLQQLLNIPSRIIFEDMSISDIDSLVEIDWEKVDVILEEKRRQSNKYIKETFMK
jgi:hypothetical protein